MSTKQIKEDAFATARGIKKVCVVSVAVIEALAWIGVLATGWVVVMLVLKDSIALRDWQFAAVAVSTGIISLRAAHELGRYFRKIGTED